MRIKKKKIKKEILMNEYLASNRIIYRKLKHLHQVDWELCIISDNGIWRIAVCVPSRNAIYVWYDYCNQMRAISLDDEDNFVTYQDCDLKCFIKLMKEILKDKIDREVLD